ncbi:hypothetical protein ABZT04_29865 [Streptomyces sp. NPDC005492]|uniref:hypothetical protein n=1 Tax=Streptomyces sp. NPDC005492 TaxID=3156883 RepID=UPI0033B2AA03
MTQALAPPADRRTLGVIADGGFKLLLGVTCAVAAAPFGRLLGASAWLLVASGVALLICGGVEIRYARSRSMRTCTRLMIAYDSGWVLSALVGALMAWQGSGAGGEVWIGYQAAAPLVFAALLVTADPAPPQAPPGTPSKPTHSATAATD